MRALDIYVIVEPKKTYIHNNESDCGSINVIYSQSAWQQSEILFLSRFSTSNKFNCVQSSFNAQNYLKSIKIHLRMFYKALRALASALRFHLTKTFAKAE